VLARSRSLLVALLTLGLLGLTAPFALAEPFAHDTGRETSTRRSSVGARIAAPDQVTEGDRYKVSVQLKAVSQIRRAEIQQRVRDIYGNMVWQKVKTFGVRKQRKLTYRAVAGETDRETYRVIVEPKSGRPVKSKPVTVAVWHWYPLTTFDSYYSTQGVSANAYNQFAMAGRNYSGSWYTYAPAASWESRYTLGRNCNTMSGVFGLTDRSSDGSSATIQVVAEGLTSVYTSPALSPGVVDTKTVPLPSPYRISVLGTHTSAANVVSYPAVGDLQFLCTGLN